MTSSYDIPSWAGKPPTGLHLDVLKEDKLVQKLMVDEKRCYLFGRNNQMNDFCIDHASCSRVHAAFVYHKHLNIAYLVDLGSTHGSYIGTLRLESNKPTQLAVNSTFHFGASTRRYILRERPTAGQRNNIMEDLPLSEPSDGALLGLPESQTELDNLTEYNTAHNRRISMLGIGDDNIRKQQQHHHSLKQNARHRRSVTFNDEEIIINPEDVDPSVGRFRNLVQTTVLPSKRYRLDGGQMGIPQTTTVNVLPSSTSHQSSIGHQMFHQSLTDMKHHHNQHVPLSPTSSLYQDLPAAKHDLTGRGVDFDISPITMGAKLSLMLPNPAPDVSPIVDDVLPTQQLAHKASSIGSKRPVMDVPHFDERNILPADAATGTPHGPQKKKYAKEAWPGRKPMLGQL